MRKIGKSILSVVLLLAVLISGTAGGLVLASEGYSDDSASVAAEGEASPSDELAGGGLGTSRVVLHHVELGRFQGGAVQIHGRYAAEVPACEYAHSLARLDDAPLGAPELQ